AVHTLMPLALVLSPTLIPECCSWRRNRIPSRLSTVEVSHYFVLFFATVPFWVWFPEENKSC
ncbi:MAG: hypothetical protein AAF587_44945, partial [Bacteroidota bacterium]